jgi:hypothetical protein
MRVDILLTHHGTHQLDRCIKVGRAYLCARCAGMYPAMALGLWGTLSGRLELGDLLTYGLSAAGVAAWGVERVRPVRFRGANVLRALAGAALGLALGVLLAGHFVEPFGPRVVGQIVLIVVLAAGFGLVDLLARRPVRKLRDCWVPDDRGDAHGDETPGAGAP